MFASETTFNSYLKRSARFMLTLLALFFCCLGSTHAQCLVVTWGECTGEYPVGTAFIIKDGPFVYDVTIQSTTGHFAQCGSASKGRHNPYNHEVPCRVAAQYTNEAGIGTQGHTNSGFVNGCTPYGLGCGS
jgi:hypothetical protein